MSQLASSLEGMQSYFSILAYVALLAQVILSFILYKAVWVPFVDKL